MKPAQSLTPLPAWLRFSQVALITLGGVAGVSAGVIQTNTGSDGGTFSVSGSDLLQTQLASASRTGAPGSGNTYFYREDSGYTVDLARLHDGQFGDLGGDPDSSIFPNQVSITFAFDVSVHTAGYNLTQIATYASWDTGRDAQQYTVEFSTVSAPNTFLSLASVARFEVDSDNDVSTKVQLTDSTGTLAWNVAMLRFNFNGVENGGTAFREFDVFGIAAVPEPQSWAMVGGVGLLGFALARRFRRA